MTGDMDMMNHKARRTRIGVACAAITVAFLGVAAMVVPSSAGGADVCDTGFTSDPEYRRTCMTNGKPEDAAVAWYVGYSERQRNADCRTAWRIGDMVTVVKETRGDVLSDNFRNSEQVIKWTARMGVADCIARGFESNS